MSRQAFIELAEGALAQTQARLHSQVGYGVDRHADRQLSTMLGIARSRRPSAAEQAAIDVDLMAAKELDADEPAYAELLCAVAFAFRRL